MKIRYFSLIDKICLFFILLTIPGCLFAQAVSPAEEFENLLNTDVVTYAQACRFVLEAAEVLVSNDSVEAFRYASSRGWLPNNAGSDDKAQLNHISRLLMRSFDIKGGLFYSITRSSRYAYRELKYMNIIQGRVDATMPVSGERLIFYVNRLLARQDVLKRLEDKRIAQDRARERMEALAAELADVIERQAIADTTVQATDEGVVITLSNIQFPADSAVLPVSEMRKIEEIAGVLGSIPGIKILVTGHTTNIGTEEYLLELSQARARSVADYLISLGACEERNVTIAGYGGSRPIADNATPAGQAANRRVEIMVLEN